MRNLTLCITRSPGRTHDRCSNILIYLQRKLLHDVECFKLFHSFTPRSDAQRTAKQKERKEQELEKCRFNAEMMEEQTGSVVEVVRTIYALNFLFKSMN